MKSLLNNVVLRPFFSLCIIAPLTLLEGWTHFLTWTYWRLNWLNWQVATWPLDLSKLFYVFLALCQRKPSTMHPFTSCNLPTWLVPCRLNATLLDVTVLKIFFMYMYVIAPLKWDMWRNTMETSDIFCMVPKFQLHSALSDFEMNVTPGMFN